MRETGAIRLTERCRSWPNAATTEGRLRAQYCALRIVTCVTSVCFVSPTDINIGRIGSPGAVNRGHPNSKGADTMAGRVAGKVAFITGAARGQGRSHAIRLAEEGADIIAVDICEDYATVGYGMATEADLAETVKAVEALDRRIFARKADVRDLQALKAAVDEGVAELGKLDIVSANAGICTVQAWDERHPGGVAGHDRHQPDRRLEHARRSRSRTCSPTAAGRSSPPARPRASRACRSSGRTPPPSTASSASAGRWPTSWPTRASGSTRSTRPAWTPRWWPASAASPR